MTDLYLRTLLFENSLLLSGHHGRQISMDISGIVLVMDTNLLELLKDCKEFLMEDSSYQSVAAGICRSHNSRAHDIRSNRMIDY